MLDSTMLDDVASTCWIRLAGPLKWPVKKVRFEAMRRCEKFVWKPSSVLACGRHSVVVEAIVSSHISVVLVDNLFKR